MALSAHLFPPLPLSLLYFTGIQNHSYTEEKSKQTGNELATLQLRRLGTNWMSYACPLNIMAMSLKVLKLNTGNIY